MTLRASEQQAQRAASLARATPKHQVPRKLVQNFRQKRVDTELPRCAQVRCSYAPRLLQELDGCPACEEGRVGWEPATGGLRCNACTWRCTT